MIDNLLDCIKIEDIKLFLLIEVGLVFDIIEKVNYFSYNEGIWIII